MINEQMEHFVLIIYTFFNQYIVNKWYSFFYCKNFNRIHAMFMVPNMFLRSNGAEMEEILEPTFDRSKKVKMITVQITRYLKSFVYLTHRQMVFPLFSKAHGHLV